MVANISSDFRVRLFPLPNVKEIKSILLLKTYCEYEKKKNSHLN